MQNRPIFIKVKDYVQAQNLTIEQVRNATADQVRNLLSFTDDEYVDYQNYESGIKEAVINYLTNAAEKAELLELKSVAEPWLLSHFPNVEFERRDRVIKIYLDGMPGVDDG